LCGHGYPQLVTKTEAGYYARCLACLTIGPERPNYDAARDALLLAASPRNQDPAPVRGWGREKG
jgi:hypothetical protein